MSSEVIVVRMRSTPLVGTTVMAALLVAALLTGCFSGASTESPAVMGDASPQSAQLDAATKSGALAENSMVAPQSSDRAQASGEAAPGTQPMIVSTVGINIEVKNLDNAVSAIRTLAAKYGATIANLSTNAGSGPVTREPIDSSSSDYVAVTPGGATITLRVPAQKLRSAEKEIAALGRVISQSSTQDDVTQQHVDMKARLKNLQAEESRLRTFFLKAKRVSERLAIEQELARVRGEIESMQAQITYLERQAAMATLTVSLSEPGALVSPAAGGWGFSAAFRDGVRAAAYVLRALITTALAFSPLIVIGLLLFFAIRFFVRRRRRHRAQNEAAPSVPPSDEQ
jgi:hypothetical protein